MDQEHSGLIALANAFMAAVNVGASRAELEMRLTELIAGFENHFRNEEELMQSSNFPGLAIHAAEHSKLIEQMSGLRDDLASGSVNVCGALADFVQVWTEQHIQGSDASLADFIREQSAGRRASGASFV
jgi:hemerythrin